MASVISNSNRVLFDKHSGHRLIGNNVSADGDILLHQFRQAIESDEWDISLPLRSEISSTTIYEKLSDGTYTQIIPDSLEKIGDNRVIVKFNTRVKGMANILLSTDTIKVSIG